MLQPALHVGYFEDFLLLFKVDAHMRGNRIGQPPWLINSRERRQDLCRYFLAQPDILLKLIDGRLHQRRGLFFGQQIGFDLPHRGDGKLLVVVNSNHRCAVAALDEHLNRAIRELQQLKDVRYGADLIEVVHTGLIV